MVANGGTIICSGKFRNINLTMGEYVLNRSMIAIPMGGVDVILGVQWLQFLGTITCNFQDFFLKFLSEGKEIELRGIIGKPRKIIIFNGMTNIFKKEQRGVIAQLCSQYVQTS